MSVLKLYTPEEVAKQLNVSTNTLSNWRVFRKKGILEGPPYVVLGNKSVRYPEDKLIEWVGEAS